MTLDQHEKLNDILVRILRTSHKNLCDELRVETVEHWDSLTHMDLIASIEQTMEIQFEVAEIIKLNSVQAIREVVARKVD